ncbi:extracellular catalytic domain type 1 short-chain-length polyhydroxyalkanoate depolymerase [Burkholderia alba]|uniref:extracellular catalytic domain type 1 short-chain-length polyhydroxyalkanoate depolymerase n=1 Tax=Burkholderia alba TaxID=2683677 RepID=UPI002B0547E5|nr:PHB depolymerase family esterase [Burkholderia alba]
MTKSLTKLWLGGMKRMLHMPPQSQPVRAAGVSSAAVSDAPGAAPRESRVRPRAAAWAGGDWVRADHPLPPVLGRFVQHLSYGLYVPPGFAADALPLVVMLHGCKQDIDQFAQGTRMNLLADRHGFAVLYPEQDPRAHPHRCWHWYDDSERGGRGEAQAVADLVDALVDEHGFDASRVYVAGMSAGAGLAALLALYHPHRFAAVALHSGPAFGEAQSGIAAMDVMRRGLHQNPAATVDALIEPGAYPGMPALIVHGDDDRVVAPKNAEQLAIEFLRLNGMADARGALRGAERIETRDDGMDAFDYRKDRRSVVRLCVVKGLAHAWAGGDDTVPFHAAVGPDASELVWSFFALQARDVVAS